MTGKRVLAIGLDGYEQALGERFIADGDLPHLKALRSRSARFLLDHGAATRTGLAWEHASTGLSPEAAGRASAVDFDPESYAVWHAGTALTPFPAFLNARTVVFDPPYFDLSSAPSARGVVNWGAHDPGIASGSRPANVLDELLGRFGPYPARDQMYDVVWASPELTRAMGDALIRATQVRAKAATWLLGECCPHWDLAFVVAGELHSAIENLWHGVDPGHPLHQLPSAGDAAARLRGVYRATDDLVGNLISTFPDATVVVFAMNGMGPNRSDVASMTLLPELLYRNDFGRPLLRVSNDWERAPGGLPMLDINVPWSQAIKTCIKQFPEPLDFLRRRGAKILPERVKKALRPSVPEAFLKADSGTLMQPLDWMPTILYRPHWQASRCFALPSFYDGRVRINLMGREREGLVTIAAYDSICDEVETLVRACRDSRTGAAVVEQVIRCGGDDPAHLGPTECDMIIVWNDAAVGFDHPDLGRIGPVPLRRTGGHTGPYGMACIAGDGVAEGSFGVRSSYDVVPTLFRLLGETMPSHLTGESLI